MTLGERISGFRRRQGLSQEALAEKLGVSRQSVSKWERNESLPETDKLPLLAQALGISLDLLLNGEEAAPSPLLSAVSTLPKRRFVEQNHLAVPAVGMGGRIGSGRLWRHCPGDCNTVAGDDGTNASAGGDLHRWLQSLSSC